MTPKLPHAAWLLALLPACAGTPAGSPAGSPARSAAEGPAAATGAAAPRLTLDAIYGPEGRVAFGGVPARARTWVDETHWVEREREADGPARWVRVDAASGEKSAWLDVAAVERALAAQPGIDAAAAARLAEPDPDRLSEDRASLLVTTAGDLWVAQIADGKLVRVTETPEQREEEAKFSPDGARIAFVADNDLWVGDARAGGATRLTLDGSDEVLNGKLDWIYQEEVYGRGTFRAFWWSPDSKHVAFLQLGEQRVPRYTLTDDARHELVVETSPYPRPGEPNPSVRLLVADVASGEIAEVDLSAHAAAEPLVVDVAWSPDGRVIYQVQDREQRWLELIAVGPEGGAGELLVRETTPAWVERSGSPHWLDDGTFLWFSERDGWKHLYRYRGAELVAQVTRGEWEVRDLHGVDQRAGLVYFSGTERSHVGSDAYAIGLDGRGLRRLTQRAGTHAVSFSTDFARFLDTWSDLATPPQVRLHAAADGAELRVVEANPTTVHLEHGFVRPELVTVPARDGFQMHGLLIKPPGFDPGRRWPVMMFVYGGPHAPSVRNAWGGSGGMLHQLVAQRGVLVWICDNRSASGKGAVSAWPAYQRLGETELADLLDSLDWLAGQGFVDESRIGISGWSYGGFLTSYALTHSKRFALGVAGGSVTDWRSYDSIYTERYMRTPQANPEGYDRTSVVKAAANLSGRLVLVHGAIDDNVHPSNTMQLAYALQRARKPFELMLYPRQRHGVTNPDQARHWRELLLGAIERTLLGTTAP
jgi:dipeptidyl-peptidase-4